MTHNIQILMKPAYLKDQSHPKSDQFIWTYTIEIRNEGARVVQLRERFWEITDANGKVQHVQGSGVVGEQPVLHPGDAFEYTSGCPLSTSSGFMVGHYTMQAQNAETFDVNIPAFALDTPMAPRVMN